MSAILIREIGIKLQAEGLSVCELIGYLAVSVTNYKDAIHILNNQGRFDLRMPVQL